jgi:hypothetical protein
MYLMLLLSGCNPYPAAVSGDTGLPLSNGPLPSSQPDSALDSDTDFFNHGQEDGPVKPPPDSADTAVPNPVDTDDSDTDTDDSDTDTNDSDTDTDDSDTDTDDSDTDTDDSDTDTDTDDSDTAVAVDTAVVVSPDSAALVDTSEQPVDSSQPIDSASSVDSADADTAGADTADTGPDSDSDTDANGGGGGGASGQHAPVLHRAFFSDVSGQKQLGFVASDEDDDLHGGMFYVDGVSWNDQFKVPDDLISFWNYIVPKQYLGRSTLPQNLASGTCQQPLNYPMDLRIRDASGLYSNTLHETLSLPKGGTLADWGDTLANATQLPGTEWYVGDQWCGDLSSASDVDYLRFRWSWGMTWLDLSMDVTDPSADYDIYLYDDQGQLLVSGASIAPGQGEVIQFAFSPVNYGTSYYVEVRHRSGPPGPWTLTLDYP